MATTKTAIRNVMKGEFAPESTFLKVGQDGSTHVVKLMEGGSIEEFNIFDPATKWTGTWEVEDKQLKLFIGEYTMIAQPNKDSMGFHKGAGAKEGGEPVSYLLMQLA